MIEKYTLYVGLNDKDTKTQIITTEESRYIIQSILLNLNISGYTIYNGVGLYKHDNGAITKEETFIIELIYIDINTVNQAIEGLKKALNQESILLQVQNTNISFK